MWDARRRPGSCSSCRPASTAPRADAVAALATGNGEARPALADVREALAGLGYGPEEVRDVLRDLPPEGDASSLLREALRTLGAQRA